MESKTEKGTDHPAGAITTTKPAPAPVPAPVGRRLHPAAIRLVAVALLFAGWIGYLVFLVVTQPRTATGAPLILSRPQILVSEVDVIAQVDGTGPEAQVVVKEVLFPKADAPVAVGQTVHVVNLARCKPLRRTEQKEADVKPDWTGPGLYLLPLQRADGDDYKVTPTPPSPGYPPTGGHVGPPRIYPATDSARAQYRSVKKP
jgi:hypothetical protein